MAKRKRSNLSLITPNSNHMQQHRQYKPSEQTQARLEQNAKSTTCRCQLKSPGQRAARQQQNRVAHSESRCTGRQKTQLYLSAFKYDSTFDYNLAIYAIERTCMPCPHCQVLKWEKSTFFLLCTGKVKLPSLAEPAEPLNSLLHGCHSESAHLMSNVQKHNSCFQMTSFGAHQLVEPGFMPTFKVQGQITTELDH